MTDVLVDNITRFDNFISEAFTGKFYGLRELVNGQAESFPVTANAVKRDRVSPMDTWQLQTYHRIMGITRESSIEEFGRTKDYFVDMRLIVIADVAMGEGFIFRFLDRFPDQTITPKGYAVYEDAYVVNTDHLAIALTEFGLAWEDKHRLVKNIWAINYQMRITSTPCV